MDPGTWLALAGLGAWAALDGASAGQLMISRPLVTGTLTGALLGDPMTGFTLGLFMELGNLGSPPVGGARLPDPGPAAVGGAAVAVLLGGGAGLALGTAWGFGLSLAGGGLITLKRQWHGRLVAGLQEGDLEPKRLPGRLALALAVEGLRGAGLAVVGVGAALAVPTTLASWWPMGYGPTLLLLAVLSAFPAGHLLRTLPVEGGRRWLLLTGGIVGAVLGGWLHGGL